MQRLRSDVDKKVSEEGYKGKVSWSEVEEKKANISEDGLQLSSSPGPSAVTNQAPAGSGCFNACLKINHSRQPGDWGRLASVPKDDTTTADVQRESTWASLDTIRDALRSPISTGHIRDIRVAFRPDTLQPHSNVSRQPIPRRELAFSILTFVSDRSSMFLTFVLCLAVFSFCTVCAFSFDIPKLVLKPWFFSVTAASS